MRSSVRLACRSGVQDEALLQRLHAPACIVDPPSPRLNVPTWTLRMPPAGSGHSQPAAAAQHPVHAVCDRRHANDGLFRNEHHGTETRHTIALTLK
jgi:hypothetical protein